MDSPARVWEGGRLVCCTVVSETADVKSFHFRAPSGRLFRHLPGQFLTVSVPVEGGVEQRCYTISSPPTRPDMLSITVKRVDGGRLSNWLHDRFRVGDALEASAPAGEFTCARHPAGRYLFVSAGSGMTPLMSMLRCLDDLHVWPDVVFIHAARTPRDILFHDEIEAIARRWPGLSTTYVCDAPGGGLPANAHPGRLTARLLRLATQDLDQREIFCCGPAPFMASVRNFLAEAGVEPGRYHEESFSGDGSVEGAATSENAQSGAGPVFSVCLQRSGAVIECGAGQTILDAARKAGLRLPASCGSGMCGTCKSQLLAGRVDMAHGSGIRQREIDRGQILPCCAKPLTDVTIDR